MVSQTNGPNHDSEVSVEALEDIKNRVKPLLGIPKAGDLIIERVATKHKLTIDRVLKIARNMKRREGK